MLFQGQSYDMPIFTHHSSLSCQQQSSSMHVPLQSYWCIQINRISDCRTNISKIFHLPSIHSVSYDVTHTRKVTLEEKKVILKDWKMVKIVRRLNLVFSSCNWHTPFPITESLPYYFSIRSVFQFSGLWLKQHSVCVSSLPKIITAQLFCLFCMSLIIFKINFILLCNHI
jgi:hypothetical protein